MKGVAEVGKKLGEMWKALSDAEKEPFNKMAADDKERYAKAMEGYTPPEGSDEPEPKKGKKAKAKKDPNAPKKALSAFILFSNAKRAEVTAELKAANPDMKGVAEVGKKLGEMWKALSDAEKEPFNKMAADDKERYAKAMEDYKLTQGGEGTQETEREMDGTQEAEVKGEQ